MTDHTIECIDKFIPVLETDKRMIILVGGRWSTKTTFAADYVSAHMAAGELWCCAREFQNSIDESVHRVILDQIDLHEFKGFSSTKAGIEHNSGGRCFYKGFSRNISSVKSILSGVDGVWIEEGETLSEDSLKTITASLRLSVKDTRRVLDGEDVKLPRFLITLNRGSSNDPIAKAYLERAESTLERQGWYEDDMCLIIESNRS